MEIENLKQSVEEITMPDEMRERILKNCKEKIESKKVVSVMKKKNSKNFSKWVPAAASICLCVVLVGGGVLAAGKMGFLKNIKRIDGAIIGQTYEQATDEITISTTYENDTITIAANIADTTKAPYIAIDAMEIGNYKILDANDEMILEGSVEAASEIVDGTVTFTIPVELESGVYKICIEQFIGSAKADQPLMINGLWTSEFVK